jgi:hypothetical protein
MCWLRIHVVRHGFAEPNYCKVIFAVAIGSCPVHFRP